VNTKAYDDSSVESIVAFARRLTGLSLAEAITLPETLINAKSRGRLGNMVEEHFFGFKPNSDHRPDFPKAGLELKTTGVRRAADGTYSAKERLVLTMIDYNKIVGETFETSSLVAKCRLMLIMFYLYDQGKAVFEQEFILDPLLFELLNQDVDIIKSDWEFIQSKVRDKKAHELSEGDTFYLGACRKGSGGDGEKLRGQPFTTELAKGRAFSLKQGYLTQLIQGHAAIQGSLNVGNGRTFQSATQDRFEPFLGKTVEDICTALNFSKSGPNHKSFYRDLSARILQASDGSVRELKKAGIVLKTVRLKASGMPRESMSFPAFDYFQLLETDWEDSDFCGVLEQKFLFVVFKVDATGAERLEKVGYWNMPYEDRQEARQVWEETRRRISECVNELPTSKENPVAHVRPHGRDSRDLAPTPCGGYQVKKSFWLNSRYIGNILADL
jgi:DNA mismatch repair protein MutH